MLSIRFYAGSKFCVISTIAPPLGSIQYVPRTSYTSPLLRGSYSIRNTKLRPHKNWMDKMQLSGIFTAKRCGSLNYPSIRILKC